jgi:amino acid transporter
VNPKSLRDLFFGRPLRTDEASERRIGIWAAIPFLGLDALGSAAYGPEAALTILMPLGAAGLRHIGPITLLIVGLLAIVQVSYRQTIAAYPDGGGSFTVASRNLGCRPGLIAGAALWLDYVLNVAVAISAGTGALVSAVPSLLPHTLGFCLGILVLLTMVNLRGVRDSGVAFMMPTYVFVLSLGAVVAVGVVRVVSAGGHPTPLAPVPRLHAAVQAGTAWLLLRAFASGCTAMTGVEAVSNAVPVFREPRVNRAKRTLTAIVAMLMLLLVGVAALSIAYRIGATEAGRPGYESVLSQLTAAVMGRGAVYDVTIGSVVAVLCLSANTSFADFPRLCRVLALDGFLPPGFAHQGARLVYSTGIILLAILAGILLVVFGGLTDRLIPLFAVGAFLAFTMSQLGMVAHWLRQPPPRRRLSLTVNAVGAAATGATLIVILVSKLAEGAWITLLLLGALLFVFRRVAAHLGAVDQDVRAADQLDLSPMPRPMVLVPMKRLDLVARKALRFALTITDDVMAVQLLAENQGEEDLSSVWKDRVETPCRQADLPIPKLVVLRSPYREVLEPLVRHVERLTRANPGRPIVVIVPEVVQRRWYHAMLHSHTSTLLKALLVQRGGPQVLVVSAPWYVDRGPRAQAPAARDQRQTGRRISPIATLDEPARDQREPPPGLAPPDRVATIEEGGGDRHA